MPRRTLLPVFTALMSAATANAGERALTILVRNYAQVDERVLGRAEAEADRVFRGVGAEFEWVNCFESRKVLQQCPLSPDATKLAIDLLPAGASARGSGPRALGFAVADERETCAWYAGVMCDRVKRLKSALTGMPVILGLAIAHELGHLLLGVRRHATSGLMKARWERGELLQVAQGFLLFGKEESSQIESNIRARLAAAQQGTRARTSAERDAIPSGDEKTSPATTMHLHASGVR